MSLASVSSQLEDHTEAARDGEKACANEKNERKDISTAHKNGNLVRRKLRRKSVKSKACTIVWRKKRKIEVTANDMGSANTGFIFVTRTKPLVVYYKYFQQLFRQAEILAINICAMGACIPNAIWLLQDILLNYDSLITYRIMTSSRGTVDEIWIKRNRPDNNMQIEPQMAEKVIKPDIQQSPDELVQECKLRTISCIRLEVAKNYP